MRGDKNYENLFDLNLLLSLVKYIVFSLFSFTLYSCTFQLLDNESDQLRIEVLDVGQGDAILISKGDFRGLVDVGPPGQKIWNNLEKRLLADGLTHIDWIIITHHHLDHFGALLEYFSPDSLLVFAKGDTLESYQGKLSIGRIYTNLDLYPSWEWSKLLEVLKEKSAHQAIDLDTLWSGRRPEFPEGINSRILWPLPQQKNVANKSSLVLEIEFEGSRVLLTGDLEETEEFTLIGNGSLRTVDLLKVGHHGSKTSTSLEFLDKLKPHHKAISYGCNNSYGHPHKSTIAHLRLTSWIPSLEIRETCLHGDLKYIVNENGVFYDGE